MTLQVTSPVALALFSPLPSLPIALKHTIRSLALRTNVTERMYTTKSNFSYKLSLRLFARAQLLNLILW
jgi:hypothetical protein